MTMTQTPSQRIAAVLRERGIERTEAEVEPWIERMFNRFSIAHQNVQREAFDEELAKAVEQGHAAWTAALHSAFGGTL